MKRLVSIALILLAVLLSGMAEGARLDASLHIQEATTTRRHPHPCGEAVDFDPYGLRRTEYEAASYATGGPCDHGYTGHITIDSPVAGQTELCLAHFRAYDPNLGRWLSADPLGELGGTNLYAYVLGDPVNFFDPLGLIEYGSWQYHLLTGASGDFIESAATAFAGFGDSFTLGLSKGIRKIAGTDHLIDPCADSYKGGEIAGVAASMFMGGAGAVKAAGGARNIAKYELGSKWISKLSLRPGRVARWNRHGQLEKGEIILKAAKGKWIKAFSPENWKDVSQPFSIKGLSTKPTQMGLGGLHAVFQIGYQYSMGIYSQP